MKAVSLISGGIDSPVATYLMLKKGVDIVAVHMDNRPFADDRMVEKFLKIIKHLGGIADKKIRAYMVPYGNAQMEFSKNCKRRFQCILCKRMMYRVAEEIAKKEEADAIITGESLGQVASQTLINLEVESQAIEIPIIRPLIGFDKEDTIKIAKDIGTYEISIMPGLCCSIVPERPATQARLEDILSEEKNVDINSIMEDLIINSKINQNGN